MSLSSAEFVLAFLCLAAFFFRLPGAQARRATFTLASGAFLFLSVPNRPTWIALAIFLLSGWWVARLLLRRPNGALLPLYFVVLVAAFVVLKQYDVLHYVLPATVLHHPIAVVGLSYMLFRQIHFLVDVSQEQIPEFSVASYLNYQLNFLTLLSGPIQRYQEFHEYWRDPRPVAVDSHAIQQALQRVMFGIIQISLIAAKCLALYKAAGTQLDAAIAGKFTLTRGFALREFATMFYLYPAYVYFNFSGYCDVAIGCGRLLGLTIPENFDRPYLSRNMIDFWTRQHMTLSFWIRDYLFTPMYKAMAGRWPSRAATSAFVCYFVAMFLAGVWHGATSNFVVFGLLHGLGVSVTKVWEITLIRRLGRPGYRQYLQKPWIRRVSTFATLNFVAFTFLFFTPDLQRTWTQIRSVVRVIV
jgi:D-alanyl-lipoteichoic acid acyltransferase DltB (MBOAT superfamily)